MTRDDEIDAAVRRGLEAAGFVAVACPVMLEGPPPDIERLTAVSRALNQYDWIICSSVRSVRAISAARAAPWPAAVRTAAVGAVTAAVMREAGASDPIVGESFNAKALWQALQPQDAWPSRRVLVATVPGGRRDLIDGLRGAGARVDELEAYSMHAREAGDIRRQWQAVRPDAVLLGSASQARHLISSVGVPALDDLKAIVAIGRTTEAVVREAGLRAVIPDEATFASGVEKLKSSHQACLDGARAKVDPSEVG